MAEQHHTPVIRVPIDQEVFMDLVEDGDVFEDATVATEVTSFERVADAYVLEGAMVFAGYMRRPSSAAQAGPPGLAGPEGGLAEPVVEHVHQRLPFVLRVPVKYQPRGLLNVNTRVPEWRLEVVSAGWVRVTAELQILGLNGDHGYHFRCGAQELGDVFFRTSPQQNAGGAPSSPPPSTEAADSSGSAAGGTAALPEDAWEHDSTLETRVPAMAAWPEMMRGWTDVSGEADAHPGDGQASDRQAGGPGSDVMRAAEAVSEARGGLGRPAAEGGAWAGADAAGGPAQQELAGFDRLLEGRSADTASGAGWGQDGAADGAEPVTFEFEHQMPADDVDQPAAPAGGPPHGRVNEEFLASRSFTPEGFRAAAGFAPVAAESGAQEDAEGWTPTNDVGGDERRAQAPEVDRSAALRATAEVDESAAVDATNEDAGASPLQPRLWSFVDFNEPERYYTLRFAVVMDEETLDAVADRVDCSKAELMRVNRLTSEEVRPGQSLLIPSPPQLVRL
ncbi:MAG: LysM peptidoglycan-binding domain-containing protein [Alicyclobacillaceae bacterium]|nr:LysM peptidoglycan-binding domain-containing protein [Alicyclobacillaceae bacterium]